MANMAFPIIRDFIILILIGILTLMIQLDFFVGENLHIRGFFRGDHSIGLPLKPDTFPPAIAAIFAFGLPVLVLIISWFAIDRIWSNTWNGIEIEQSDDIETFTSVPLLQRAGQQQVVQRPPTTAGKRSVFHWGQHVSDDSTPRSRKLRFALYQFFVLCLGMCFVIIVTTAIKLMVARLRPDFAERCKLDYSSPDLVIDPETGYIDGKFTTTLCRGDIHEIIEGRKSFPSAHSSTALYGGTFTSLVFFKRCWNRGQRNASFLLIPFLIMCTIGGALVIAVSRNFDNRHHPLDIIVGSCIGILCALWTLAFNIYTPSWELDGSLADNKLAQTSSGDV